MEIELRLAPQFSNLKNERSDIEIVCRGKYCDKSLLTRWFCSVASLIHIANEEFLALLQRFHTSLAFKLKKKNFVYTPVIKGITYENVEIPIIVGTHLWFIREQVDNGFEIDYLFLLQWKSLLKSPFEVKCPFCCYSEYIPLGCFFLNEKMYRLPTFAAVDSKRLHLRKPNNNLTVYIDGEIISEDNEKNKHLIEPLLKVKDEIEDMRDMIFNYSFHTVGRVLSHKIEMSLQHILSSKIKTKGQISGILNKLAKDLSFGNVTTAVSKRGNFATAELGGQSHETQNLYDHGSIARITDVECRQGFVKASSRYIVTSWNNPIHVIFAPMHTEKLVSADVKTKSHQALQSSSCAYFCKIHTMANKLAGLYLELLPGVKFTRNYHSVSQLIQIFEDACKNNTCEPSIVFFPNLQQISLKLDIEALENIVFRHDLTPNVYFWPKKKLCIVYSHSNDIIDDRFGLTPLTRHCLLTEFPERWAKKLSPSIDGNVPVLGTFAHQFFLLNHNATSKVIQGIAGSRHALGAPITCRVPARSRVGRTLVYPQNDFVNTESIVKSSQMAVTLIAPFHASGVDDGIIINKASRDKGIGMVQNDNVTIQYIITLSESELIIAVPVEDNTLKIVFQESSDIISRNSDYNVTIDMPSHIRHAKVVHDTFVCEIIGHLGINSFNHDGPDISYQQCSRIIYRRFYDVGESRNFWLHFDTLSVKNMKSSRKNEVMITLYFSEFRHCEVGDKFSNITGQKVTVTDILPAEDFPFTIGSLCQSIDMIYNISCCKRQTYGMSKAGICCAAKALRPDDVDLSILRGDTSLRHNTGIDDIYEICKENTIMADAPIFSGFTGMYMGTGDIALIEIFRYEQDGYKNIFYTPWNKEKRSRNGDFHEKGRSRTGGLKWPQTNEFLSEAQGSDPNLKRELQQTSEPRTCSHKNTGKVTQSFITTTRTCNVHGLDIVPE